MAKYGSYEGFLGPGTRNLHPIPTFQVCGLAFKKTLHQQIDSKECQGLHPRTIRPEHCNLTLICNLIRTERMHRHSRGGRRTKNVVIGGDPTLQWSPDCLWIGDWDTSTCHRCVSDQTISMTTFSQPASFWFLYKLVRIWSSIMMGPFLGLCINAYFIQL